MSALFILIYIIFLFFVGILSFFVIYHLRRYSINPRLTRPLGTLFIALTVILVCINAVFFFSIPFDELFRSDIRF